MEEVLLANLIFIFIWIWIDWHTVIIMEEQLWNPLLAGQGGQAKGSGQASLVVSAVESVLAI